VFSGEMASKSTVKNVNLTFTKAKGGCNSEVETLVLKNLKGRLGLLNKSGAVGLLLEPVTQPVAKCGEYGVNWEYRGTIVVQITPVGVNTTKFSLGWRLLEGKQEFLGFEGKKPRRSCWAGKAPRKTNMLMLGSEPVTCRSRPQ
jgi:hypothetical protein